MNGSCVKELGRGGKLQPGGHVAGLSFLIWPAALEEVILIES